MSAELAPLAEGLAAAGAGPADASQRTGGFEPADVTPDGLAFAIFYARFTTGSSPPWVSRCLGCSRNSVP